MVKDVIMNRFLLLALCFWTMSAHAQRWVISYPMVDGVTLAGGCCNDDGNFIVGACNDVGGQGYSDGYAIYVDRKGEYVEKRFAFDGYKSHLCNAIGLDDGNAFVVGVKGGTPANHIYDTLWIAIMTPTLEIVEEHAYPLVEPYLTWTTDVYLDFNNYGDVMVLADVSERDYPEMTNGVYAVFRCDIHGNVLDSRYFADGHGVNGARPSGIIRVPNSDRMMLLGKGFYLNNCHSVCYIDNDLDIIATYPLPWLENKRNYTDCWKDNGHFLMASTTHHYGSGNNSFYAAVFEVDAQGHYVDTLVYDRADTLDYTAQYGSMAYVDDDEIYVATYWENGLNELPSDAVICLIDSDLNLKGTKRLAVEDVKIRLMHCQRTADGSCLFYGQCKKCHDTEMVCVWKLSADDFAIPWTLHEEPEVLPRHRAFPNPTGDVLNIVSDDFRGCVVSIIDLSGRKHFERKFDDTGCQLTLDVSSLEEGVYFYEVFNGNVTQKGKFIKN